MLATVASLTIAFKRMQERDAVGYQRWLRARVLAQGLTIVAIVVAGVQEMGVGVLTGGARTAAAAVPPTSPWESREFEKRLKQAEEAHRAEAGEPEPASPIVRAVGVAAPAPQAGSSSWISWLRWGKK